MPGAQLNWGTFDTKVSSRIDVDEAKFAWDIDNFIGIVGITESCVFQGGPKAKYYWKLGINSEHSSIGDHGLSIGLKFVSFGENFDTDKGFAAVGVKIAIAIVDCNDKIIKERHDACVIQVGRWHFLEPWGLYNFCDNNNIPHDKLRVRCRLSIELGLEDTSDVTPTLNGPFSDIVIISQQKCFLVHRKVLLAKVDSTSPFFTKFLAPKEKFDLFEIPYQGNLAVLPIVLEYLYTGEISVLHLESYPGEINDLSKLFGLPELRAMVIEINN